MVKELKTKIDNYARINFKVRENVQKLLKKAILDQLDSKIIIGPSYVELVASEQVNLEDSDSSDCIVEHKRL